jgi:hypothetical protein
MVQLSPVLVISPPAKNCGGLKTAAEDDYLRNGPSQAKASSLSVTVPQETSSYADPKWIEPRRILRFKNKEPSLQEGILLNTIRVGGPSLEEPNAEFVMTNPGELLIVIAVR